MNLLEPWPLPASWHWAEFRDVAEVKSDLRDPSLTPEAVHIAPNHIEPNTGRLVGRGTVAGDRVTSPKHAFTSGQILYSKIRPYLAKVAMADCDGLCSADMYPISARQSVIEPRFLRWWLLSPAFTQMASDSQGRTVLPKINQAALYRKPVPIPPLAEQKRIADKLDALLARVDACRERLDRVPITLNTLRRATLDLAVRGLLVPQSIDDEPASKIVERVELDRAALRARGKAAGKDPSPDFEVPYSLPSGWVWISAEQLGRPDHAISYGILKPVWVRSGVPTVRVTEMKGGSIDLENLPQCDPVRASKFLKTKLVCGDLLVSKDGTIGKTAFVPAELEGGNITQHLLRFSICRHVDRRFVRVAIDSPFAQAWMKGETRGVALQGVSVGDFRRMPIPLPPLAEQRRIVAKVAALMQLFDRIEARCRVAQADVGCLTSSMLSSAFRGEFATPDRCGAAVSRRRLLSPSA